tara:strand:+ start:94 stop:294 length:201 start_codon:yes stop_codon:yes gene_type:complete
MGNIKDAYDYTRKFDLEEPDVEEYDDPNNEKLRKNSAYRTVEFRRKMDILVSETLKKIKGDSNGKK